MIRQNFPEIEVQGENYPPPPMQSMMASMLGYLKIAFILCVVSGYNVFDLVGIPTPQFMTWALENKVGAETASQLAFLLYHFLLLFYRCMLR